MANCSRITWLVWAIDYKEGSLIADAIKQSLAHACVFIIKVWVGAVFLPEQTSMDGLGFSIAESVARHRSCHDEYKLIQFAPLGKSVLTLTSCSADMNGKTLKLSKQEYCKVWGEAF